VGTIFQFSEINKKSSSGPSFYTIKNQITIHVQYYGNNLKIKFSIRLIQFHEDLVKAAKK